ncbi:MAG: chromosomal replication initiator protein DnaA [Verrucomicrobiae bacterium]|nr:chromosomal replication initiator protein DnaA [Verrucomicrobiae bacterium]
MENAVEIWGAVSRKIKPLVSQDTYARWFSSLAGHAFENNSLTLSVPNAIYQFWIEDNYLPLIREQLSQELGCPVEVRFAVLADQETPGSGISVAPSGEAPVVPTKPRTEMIASQLSDKTREAELNSKYVFDTFVVGANNSYAHAACMGVASAPARTYNPLFLHGGVGLGKTHLMQAIGHHIISRKKHAKVVYITCEKFTNEFIDAIQNNALVKFRKKYRSVDVLLIDDIQFLAGKEKSQDEFFHTFNTLHDGHKQIVLTCDRPASEIAGLEQRLVSRFEWGFTGEIQAPDQETREAILRKKAASFHITLPDEIFKFLASRIKSNVRRLEGALYRIAVHCSLNNGHITPEEAEHHLRDLLQEESKRTVSIDLIQKRVAERFDIRVADMTSKRRPASIAFPRQVAMYLCRHLTPSSLTDIGENFGGRDHGTVIHACKLVRDRMELDDQVRQTVHNLMHKLQRE